MNIRGKSILIRAIEKEDLPIDIQKFIREK